MTLVHAGTIMTNKEIQEDTLERRIIKEWTSRMDRVFGEHIGKDVKPYVLEDEKDVLAICLGIGLADFKICQDNELKLETKKPVSVFWDGEKFMVYHHEVVGGVAYDKR